MSKEFLIFSLGAKKYGIDILFVQSILLNKRPIPVANAPLFLRGVLNFRGVTVPIVDLSLKLGYTSVKCNRFTVIIILNVRGRNIGVAVDSVPDVRELSDEVICPESHFDASIDIEFMDIEAVMESVFAELAKC